MLHNWTGINIKDLTGINIDLLERSHEAKR